MAKHLFILGFALLILVQTPFIYSISCDYVSLPNQNICIDVINSNLTQQEQELIISNLDYNNKFFPDHNFVYKKNTNIKIGNAPEGINTYNDQFVKNAWLSIFTAMPSVIYNNSLYVPDKTTIFSGFNYKLNLPNNYYSNSYPQTSQGNCKRIYTLIKNESENKIYVNNQYQGSGKLVDVNINTDSEIKAKYNITIAINVDHYNWAKYCVKYKNGKCVSYSYTCKFSYNEILQDNVKLYDTINVKHYENRLIGEIIPVDYYDSSNKLRLNYSDSFYLTFNNSYFKFNKFIYTINYSKAPYYIYTLKATDYNQEQINNLFKSGNDITIKDTSNCNINAFDFFNIVNKSCISENKNNSLSINIDKLTYKPNETILISIYPNNIPINISYGNKSKIAIGNTSFIAILQNNKISADYKDYHTEKIIFVEDLSKTNLILDLSLFSFLNYVIYIVLKKSFWRLI